MKKYNVFKVLFIALFAAIIFSFFIPQSQMGYGGIEKGLVNPITLVDTVSNTLTSFSVFIASFVYILSIGIFYSVLKNSEKYDDVITNTAAKFKKKGTFIVISALTLGLLTAVIGDVMPMLIFVPAFIDIAKKLGYDSKRAILSTVGAILFGSAGSLYTNYSNQILTNTVQTNIIVKLVILVISLLALILFVILTDKEAKAKLEKKKIKKGLPIILAFDIIMVLLILGMVPWSAYFGFNGFNYFHETIIGAKLFKVSVFNALVGTTLTAFGTWTVYSLTVIILIVSVILSLIYKLKIDGLFDSLANGVKKAFPYALILVFANMILVGVYNSGFYTTVITSIAGMKDKVLSSTTLSLLSSIVYPDYTYATQFTLSTITQIITNTKIYAPLAIIFQSIYSLALLISPTSILLLMALKYEDVSYKDWFKFISKFFLGLLIIFFIIILIIANKYVKVVSYVVLSVLIVILVLLIVLCKTKKKTKETKKDTKSKKDKKSKK